MSRSSFDGGDVQEAVVTEGCSDSTPRPWIEIERETDIDGEFLTQLDKRHDKGKGHRSENNIHRG